MANDWLEAKHPIYDAWRDIWRRNEARLRGGDDVLGELVPFDHETRDGDAHRARKAQATYINFPDLFMRAMIGHLMREAPEVDTALSFGTLGEVRREDGAQPSRAELVYYNADGAGSDGSQWENYWLAAVRRAGATGHRWILVEAPAEAPANEADERDGLRPYLVEYSPLSVPNWHYERGRLAFAVVRTAARKPRVENDRLVGNIPEPGYLLLVRQGWEGFGDEYRAGGWWRFNADREPVAQGTWEKTDGEIPLFPLFYERDEGSEEVPAMSRPGTTELSQVAISHMNLSSAADYDAWDAGASRLYITGVDLEAWKLLAEKEQEGSKIVPVVTNEQSGGIPQIHDGSLGTVAAEVFETRLERKRKEATEIAAREATSTPDSSGRSKEAGFLEAKAPRLALLASELEQAQNTAIHFLEQRFGMAASEGFVRWPRQFDLQPLEQEIREMFELEAISDLRSPTVGAKAMATAARMKRIIGDDETAEQVEVEYRQAATERQMREAQAAAEGDAIRGALFAGAATGNGDQA